jgi:hypothetical protein
MLILMVHVDHPNGHLYDHGSCYCALSDNIDTEQVSTLNAKIRIDLV